MLRTLGATIARRLRGETKFTLAEHGIATLRGALPPVLVDQLRRFTEEAFQRVDRDLPKPISAEEVTADVGNPLKLAKYHGWLKVDDVAAMTGGQFASALSEAEALIRPAELRFAPHNSVCRRQSARSTATPVHWHRDYGTAFYERPTVGINAWVPLVPIDGRTPSLELIPGSHVTKGEEFTTYPEADAVVRQRFSRCPRYVPRLSPGDVVLFSQYVLHRTEPGKSRERVSMELRFAN